MFFNILILSFLSSVAFYIHEEKLFFGLDGLGLSVTSRLMANWSGYGIGLMSNPFQGLGALYTLNINLIPTLSLMNYFPGLLGMVAAYSLCAIELFIAVYVLGRGMNFTPAVSRLAGWILPLVCLPFFSNSQIYPVFNLAPNMAEVLAVATFGLGCFCISVNSAGRERLLAVIGVILSIVWIFASQPTYLVLFGPTTLSIFLIVLFMNGPIKHSLIQALPTILIVGVFFAAGGFFYILGIYTFTAAAFFSSELNPDVPRTMYFTSILFQSSAHGALGKLLVTLSLMGGFLMALHSDTRPIIKQLAIPFVPFALFGLIFMSTSGNWPYPFPIYFEFSLWPLYGLLAAYAIMRSFVLITRLIGQNNSKRIVIFGVMVCGLIVLVLQEPKPTGDILGRPPQKTPIVSHLANAIGMATDPVFKGYSANFSGNQGRDESLSWGQQVNQDVKIARETGNSHRLMGLWEFSIPTLEEYQPINNPFLYAFVSRLLSRDIDTQTRNLLMLSNIKIDLLQMMGVRFVIRDTMIDAPATLREKIEIAGITDLYLYELPHSNVGQYSPTRTIVAKDAKYAISLMSLQDINYRDTAIVSEPLQGELVPIVTSKVRLESGGYRVQASSGGRSMLLLPTQFSNCLQALGPDANRVKLVRANLILTGIIFDRQLDIKLEKSISPFSNSGCRWADRSQAVEAGLGQLSNL